jgi:hypothetical protein
MLTSIDIDDHDPGGLSHKQCVDRVAAIRSEFVKRSADALNNLQVRALISLSDTVGLTRFF